MGGCHLLWLALIAAETVGRVGQLSGSQCAHCAVSAASLLWYWEMGGTEVLFVSFLTDFELSLVAYWTVGRPESIYAGNTMMLIKSRKIPRPFL